MGTRQARQTGHARVSIMLAAVLALGGAAGEALAQPAGPPAEGIKIHGRWTIEVRNPDGSVASTHEFHNALVPQGALLLSGFLGRRHSPGWWRIILDSTNAALAPCFGVTEPIPCALSEASFPTPVPLRVLTLIAPASPSGVPTASIALAATFTIDTPRPLVQFDRVSTFMWTCGDTTSPAACIAGTSFVEYFPFTSHDLAQPIQLRPGQVVQLMVVFSFS